MRETAQDVKFHSFSLHPGHSAEGGHLRRCVRYGNRKLRHREGLPSNCGACVCCSGRGRGPQDFGPPSSVVEAGVFQHPCEGEAVLKLTNVKIPYFNAPIYLENITQVSLCLLLVAYPP
jgi:hypothetical protein